MITSTPSKLLAAVPDYLADFHKYRTKRPEGITQFQVYREHRIIIDELLDTLEMIRDADDERRQFGQLCMRVADRLKVDRAIENARGAL